MKGLGRGLNSLLSIYDDEDDVKVTTSSAQNVQNSGESIQEIDINKIKANPNQPRKVFEEEPLKELAQSIKLHGIIQPIVVNKEDDGTYMIIAGERRYRASKLAGLDKIPAIIKNYAEKQVKEVALIENLQRENLNPIEAARAVKDLMEVYSLTQDAIADRIGKSRPAITNMLRLLSLDTEVIKLVEANRLSAGHARCLVVIPDKLLQVKLAKTACDNKMSVRDLEKAVKEILEPKQEKKKQESQSLELKELIANMQRTFATKVTALGNDRRGRIYIDYYSKDDLDRIQALIESMRRRD